MSDRLERAVQELVEALREEVRRESAAAVAEPDRLLSVREAAEALGVSRSVLYGEIGAGRLRMFKVGRRRLLSQTALHAYSDEAERHPGGSFFRPA